MSVLGHRLRAYVPPTSSALLDTYGSAAVAYSVRKLRTAYSGSCMRIRRTSDSAEQDIGFVGNDVDTASALSFVGASNGIVVVWYDQSGNGVNLDGIITLSHTLILGGVLNTKNAKPCVVFDDGGLYASYSPGSIASASVSALGYLANEASDTNARLVSMGIPTTPFDTEGAGGIFLMRDLTTERVAGYKTTWRSIKTVTYDQLHIMQSVYSGTEHIITVDGSAGSTLAEAAGFSPTQFYVGASPQAEGFKGGLSEVVMWPSNQTSNIASIRTDQKTYFGTA